MRLVPSFVGARHIFGITMENAFKIPVIQWLCAKHKDLLPYLFCFPDDDYTCYMSVRPVQYSGYKIGVTCTYDSTGAFVSGFKSTYAGSFYQLYHPRGRGAQNAYFNSIDSYNNWISKYIADALL